MKYVMLAVALLAVAPLASLIESSRTVRRMVWRIVGFLPFVSTVFRTQVALVAWPEWKGHTFGLEIALIDLLALALFITRETKAPVPFPHVIFLSFLLPATVSVFMAPEPTAAVFFVWQFIRVTFVAYVIASQSEDDAISVYVMQGMIFGLAIEMVSVVFEKMVLHVVQPSGTFVHQNILGFVCHFIVYPNLALALAGRRTAGTFVALVSGCVIAAMSGSRGAVGFTIAGLGLTYLFSLLSNPDRRKVMFAVAGSIFVAGFLIVANQSFQERAMSGDNPFEREGYDERAAFNTTASLILHDFPFGIGANNYVYGAYNWGYALKGGVAPVEANLSTIVHNAFWLTAAETGYAGVAGLVLLFTWSILSFAKTGWIGRATQAGAFMQGCSVSLLIIFAHSFYEWILYSVECQYLLGLTIGMGLLVQKRVLKAAQTKGSFERTEELAARGS